MNGNSNTEVNISELSKIDFHADTLLFTYCKVWMVTINSCSSSLTYERKNKTETLLTGVIIIILNPSQVYFCFFLSNSKCFGSKKCHHAHEF